jgi:glycosyltransferase involved in cell wall biosynthesis
MDNAGLGECRARFAISRNVAERLQRYNGLTAEPLYPPPQHLGRYHDAGDGDYLFYAGRLDRLKRLDLLLDALARTPPDVRVKLAGSGPMEGELRRQAAKLGLEQRVDFLGFVSADELLELYAGCRAAYYAPLNEDYGYVTVEAFLSGKPVVTSSDAGGPLEFVRHDENGLVAAPEAEALAAALERLWAWPAARRRAAGLAGRATVAGITWAHVIDRLTETLGT